MRVKYLTLDAGPDGCHVPGSIADVSDEEAALLVDGKYAEYVDPPKKKGKETAAKTPPETATN